MAVLQGHYDSKCLRQDTQFVLIRPFEGRERAEERYLILLHGLMDNSTAWLYKTSLLRLADAYGVTVFCPEGRRGFYCDMAYGADYLSMVIREIPEVMGKLLGCELNGDNTVLAGNSMGGYGALKATLNHRSFYRKVMAFSPVISPMEALNVIPDDYLIPGEEKAAAGERGMLRDEDDLYTLARRIGKPGYQITVTCGKDDFLIGQNREVHTYLKTLGLEYTYREEEGVHGWDYWETHLPELFQSYFSV